MAVSADPKANRKKLKFIAEKSISMNTIFLDRSFKLLMYLKGKFL